MSSATQIAGLGSYLDAFSRLEQRAPRQPEWLRSLRQDAFSRFCDAGFPTTKDEDWRFTNVAPISQSAFVLEEAAGAQVTAEDLQPFLIHGAACLLVFVNGRFAPELSDRQLLPEGIEAGGLAAGIADHAAPIEAQLGRYLNIQRDSFCALNTAFLEDGAYIHVARGTVLKEPMHLLFISTETDAPQMLHPRNLLIAERDAQVSFVEQHISLNHGGSSGAGSSAFFSNAVTELVAAENAVVSHHLVELENRSGFHISTLRVQQERSSNVSLHSLLVGGALVRNNIHPVLAGEGAECLINGLFIGDDLQHLDNYMLVEHASPHCSSKQFYNGILGGKAHGVFHGRIIVHKDAQKTDSKQTNRNLLLSDDAQIDTKPQLEIYADDVKCTHGATIGQIDENALFYLRSRCIDEDSARAILLFAFAGECLERMKSGPLRKYLAQIVRESMPEMTLATGSGSDIGRHWEEVG